VPLAKVYILIPKNFRIAYTNETKRSSVEVTLADGAVHVGWLQLPDLGNLEGWLSFERNGRSAALPDARFGDYLRPDATDGVLTVPLKGSGYSFGYGNNLTDSHPMDASHRRSCCFESQTTFGVPTVPFLDEDIRILQSNERCP
jgi:hypothetical protein